MRVLAVLAVVATIPLWAPPDHVTTSDGVFMVAAAAPPGVAAVRLAALVLVVLLAGADAVARQARRRSLYAVPALALSWVWWRTEGGGSYTVALFGSAGQEPAARVHVALVRGRGGPGRRWWSSRGRSP